MITWGGLALIMCAFIVPPIVALLRSAVSARRVWTLGVPLLTISHYLGWSLGPVIFSWMAGWAADRLSGKAHLALLAASLAFGVVVSGLLYVAKRRHERAEAVRKSAIHAAMDKILEDGVVSGPQGRYVRHRPWSAGTEPGTPHESEPPQPTGPYGSRMP